MNKSPPTEQVCDPSTQEEHAAEEDRVGGHDPLQALLAEVQVGLDRRQRDVHDRDIEDDHELRGDDHRQADPAPSVSSDFRRTREDTHRKLLSLVLAFVSSVPAACAAPRYGSQVFEGAANRTRAANAEVRRRRSCASRVRVAGARI